MKQVVYFLGKCAPGPLKTQEGEVQSAELMSYDEALGAFQFGSARRVLADARAFLDGANDVTEGEDAL